MELDRASQLCTEIFDLTQDGDLLSPDEMNLVEAALSFGWDNLCEQSRRELELLHSSAISGGLAHRQPSVNSYC